MLKSKASSLSFESIEQEKILFLSFFKWLAISLFIGITAGSAGALFSISIHFLTNLRLANSFLIWFLPLGGVVIVFLYRLAGIKKPQGTNLIIDAIRSPEPIPLLMSPLIYISSCLTHLFGGSAGREGAALQIGGSLGYHVGKVFKLDEKDLHLATMCGMAACFSALFGTPVTAAVFVMEIVTIGSMYYSALVPCTIASIVGKVIAGFFGIAPTSFHVNNLPSFEFVSILQIIILAAACAIISLLFCFVMHKANSLYEKYFSNSYIRILVGAGFILLLTRLVGIDYMGIGENILESAFSGVTRPESFLLKLIFTALTLGAGFKGGEIVPAFFVGATFGNFFGGLIGIDPSFAAAIGFLCVFCGVTNCPISTLLLSLEVFGEKGFLFYFLAIGVSYMLSGNSRIYEKQKILYAKHKLLFQDY
ncbi:chloride channel protein [Scatolibacter rhodanostii]|uniref:chloride channel protein n=1 Tax=Scatolibacter rhodanostii TaxID=2014781 RepID=UPI000C080DB3|nr:chloride channel protein [Scatolibacter rhodanostii]